MVRKVLAAGALAALAFGAAACSGTAEAAPASGGSTTRTSAGSTAGNTGTISIPTTGTTATSAASSTPTATAQQTAASGNQSSNSHSGCGNDDLKISFGYGDVGGPLQATAIVFKNISDHTCTLQGYPGAAIQDGSTLINAVRVLNGVRPYLPLLTSPPLVTLAPGGVSYAILEWKLDTNVPCYPTGTGTFEVTAPNTTKTVVIGRDGHMGVEGICSALEINPVVPGTWGVAVGN